MSKNNNSNNPIKSPKNDDKIKPGEYWTEEKKKNAKPIPLPLLPPNKNN